MWDLNWFQTCLRQKDSIHSIDTTKLNSVLWGVLLSSISILNIISSWLIRVVSVLVMEGHQDVLMEVAWLLFFSSFLLMTMLSLTQILFLELGSSFSVVCCYVHS